MPISPTRRLNISLPLPVAELQAPFPKPQQFHKATQYRAFAPTIARLWLSEGIPYAFRSRPAVYEVVREWLAERLQVNPKDITLIGSSRSGFSLSSDNPWRAFLPSSDLDFSVISEPLLTRVAETFDAWASDYVSGAVTPETKAQARYWPANIDFGKRNIPRGFMDPHKIPYLNRYSLAQHYGQTMFLVTKALAESDLGLKPRTASIRVYRSWDVLIARLGLAIAAMPAPPVQPN